MRHSRLGLGEGGFVALDEACVVGIERNVGNGLWEETDQDLGPSDANPWEAFGSSIAMTSNRIVVGAPLWDNPKDAEYDRL